MSWAPTRSPPPPSPWDPWTVKDVLIPSFAGRGLVKKYHQRRTLYQYLTMSLAGLWAFYNLENNGYRAFALGLLFPGAGHTAVATFPSLLAFIATVALFPVTIFIWFAMGGIFFPLALYLGSAVAAGFMVRPEGLWQPSATLWAIFCYSDI
ncbi:hypothetical protein Sste5344_003065 [Sporothrix stenoceras]